jgi:hypothetical protein
MWLKLDPAPGWIPPLTHELRLAGERCARAEGAQPSADKVKEWCVHVAFQLIHGFSKAEPTGTAEKPFRVISTLVYEIVTGKPKSDLKRACDNRLGEIKKAQATFKVQFKG